MKIIEPKVELLSELNISQESHIARCSRICYGHEDKEPNQETDKKMVDGLIKRGHLSMLRHSSVYLSFIGNLPTDFISEYVNTKRLKDYICASTNKQFMLESDNRAELNSYTPLEFLNLCKEFPELFELYRMTFCLTTQIGTSRELNRKSPNAIAERSTRYCSSKDGLEICRPWWFNNTSEDMSALDITKLPTKEKIFAMAWKDAEEYYNKAIENGMKPEDTRGILPLDTATKVIYTYSIREWQHILDLRYYGTTGKPHPNVHVVMQMVKDRINNFAEEHNIDYQV